MLYAACTEAKIKKKMLRKMCGFLGKTFKMNVSIVAYFF